MTDASKIKGLKAGSVGEPRLGFDRIDTIPLPEAREFVKQYHYSEVMPRITKVCLGGYQGTRLVAIVTLGFGTRPFHTIARLFPSLGTADYLEVGKLCLAEDLPRNSESMFLAMVSKWVRTNRPAIKLLFSWADGIIGKPGIVYQAANFLYGGYIWTEMYLDQQGNRVHVRSMQGNKALPQSKGRFRSRALTFTSALGYTKYWGLQFRYVLPLCDKREWKRLLAESPFEWNRQYPKHSDCRWKVQREKGKKVDCPLPDGIKTKYVINKT